jgi:hypothetical protein
MLKAPQGIWGVIGDTFNIHLFPIQRRVGFGGSSSSRGYDLFGEAAASRDDKRRQSAAES